MGFDSSMGIGTVAVGSRSPVSVDRWRVYPRLAYAEPAEPVARRHWLAAVGSTLLEMPWLAWIAFDAMLVNLGVYLGYRFIAWGEGLEWLRLAWWQTGLIQSGAFLLASLIFGLYEQQALLRHSRILARSVLGTAASVILASIFIHLFLYEELSRRVLFMAGVFYLAIGPSLRLFVGWCVNSHSRKFVIVGTDRKSRLSLTNQDTRHGDALSRRYRMVGYIAMDSIEVGREIDDSRVLGTIDDLEQICIDHEIDEVVVGAGPARNPRVLDRVLGCLKLGCRVTNLATFYEQVMSEVPVVHLEPNWFLFADLKHYREAQLIMKRVFDLVGATIGLMLSLPFWPLIALLIKIDSAGPVFYSQRRVGLNGRPFRLYKFRTMKVGAERNGHTWATEDDPRVTHVGWYLRKTRLDELPQLWNILRGHMSVVGPRPERPEFVEELATKIRFYNERHLVKPGLSGWAQINYRYGASVDDARRKLQLDLWYLKHMSVELDLIILLRTLGTVFLGSR